MEEVKMIGPTGAMIRSGNRYGKFAFSFPNKNSDKLQKDEFKLLTQPIKSAASHLIKLISAFNKDAANLTVKLENAPSGFVAMFTKKNSRKK
jgi:hypothetical protein